MRHFTQTIPRVVLLGGLSLLLTSCGDKPLEADYPLEVVARAEGVGVEGVSIKLNDEEIGQTDEEGRFEGTYHGTEGAEVTIEILPPGDYKLAEGAEGKLTAKLAAERPKEGEPKPKPLSFGVDLAPTSIEYAALIAAPGKFRPIYLGEELKGRTNALGAEVLYFRGKPGSEIQIRIDTQSKKNPPLLKKVTLDEENRVITVDGNDELKEESEEVKAARIKESAEREAKAVAALEEKAKKQGGVAAVAKVEKVKAAPKEQEEADAVDLEAVKKVVKKESIISSVSKPTVAAKPKVEQPKAEPYEKGKAKAAIKDLQGIVASINKQKAEASKLKGKIDKLAKQPGGSGAAASATSAQQTALTKIDQSLEAAKGAVKAAQAGDKAKDMLEINRQLQVAKLAATDAEEALADANSAVSGASEQANKAAEEARKHEGEARTAALAAIEAGSSAVTAGENELKGLVKDAALKIKAAKKGQKEAKGFAKEIDAALKALAKPKKELAGLKKKAPKAKAETLPDLTSQANAQKGEVDGIVGRGRAAMSKIVAATSDAPVAVAPPERKGKVPSATKVKTGKPPVPTKPGDKCPPDLACELETLQSAVGEAEVDRCLIAVCEKTSLGGANAEDIFLALAKYWGRQKKASRQLAMLDKAISFGQYKYDPSVLYGTIKVAVTAGNFEKALEVKDRFMQVKERLPVEERKTKISEILSVLAQAYEHRFYQQQEKHEDQDFTPLLNNAIQFWEEYGSYSGDKGKATQKIEALKKLRDEMNQ